MTLALTFKDVCATIKKQAKKDPTLIAAVDSLLGLALVCSPVVLGPDVAALLPTLAAKNELIKIGKIVFDKLRKQKDEDYLKRQETMEIAYGLLVFTAFFDALDARIPKALRDEIALLESEKAVLVREAVRKSSGRGADLSIDANANATVADIPIVFPHPTETLDDQMKRHARLWLQMSRGFMEFLTKLAFWENASEIKLQQIFVSMEGIEIEAGNRFEAQYYELTRKFEDFAIWANLHEHKKSKALIGQLSDYVKQHVRLSTESAKTIDVGFARLHEAVRSIPETLKTQCAAELAESLNKHYQARIHDPIIDDTESADEGKARLVFPRIRDAFVPQAFHVMRLSTKSVRLEEESTWKDLPRRNDLGPFLLNYLSSPYSTQTPLLVLGHPGGGKSLLTTVLAAQLMSKQFTAIRVPLREVRADADIVSQIEDAIRQITGVSVDSWIKLSARFENSPPIVILDGYDELLQASGRAFAGYVRDAQRFQEREEEQGRPLRIIITSRLTLIDKAVVPVGSTVIRLLEFDATQRDCWCAVWNRTNANYFRDASIEKFSLPKEQDPDARQILTLAEQPLLLLMLAIYDSQGNELRKSSGLDRTKLYDSLLRRFVARERGKEKGFADLRPAEREKALSLEMQRLGVAALGMYNRRKVHILASDLDADLAFFELERDVAAIPGKTLSQAELLLGSFFFVHKSKARHTDRVEQVREEIAVFEFLHSTFGEFLTSDFIVRRAVAQVQALHTAGASDALRSTLDRMMSTADGLERDWFSALVFTPLFTRPVIMEMTREWAPHVFREHDIEEKAFTHTLEQIVLNQVRRLLNKREMPSIMYKDVAQEGYKVPFGEQPLLGHVAIYSVNLILLRVILCGQPFEFDEQKVASHESGARPWDRLIHIWRSWFSLGALNGLSAVMLASRANAIITVSAKRGFEAVEAKGRLEEWLDVAAALGDNVLSGLSGLVSFEPHYNSSADLDQIEQQLTSEGIDVGLDIAVKRLLALKADFPSSLSEFVRVTSKAMKQAVESGDPEEIEQVCVALSRALVGPMASTDRTSALWQAIGPKMAAQVALREPRSGCVLWDLAKELMDYQWMREFSERFLEEQSGEESLTEEFDQNAFAWIRLLREMSRGVWCSTREGRSRPCRDIVGGLLHPSQLLSLYERTPEAALPYVQLVRETSGRRLGEWIRHFGLGPEFFERLLDLDRLTDLIEIDPEGALAYVDLLREIRGSRPFGQDLEEQVRPGFFERMYSLKQVLDLSDLSPDLALAYVKLLREIGGARAFEYLRQDLTSGRPVQHFSASRLANLFLRKPVAIAVWLMLARSLSDSSFTKLVAAAVVESLRGNGGAAGVERLPIQTLRDLYWLADQSKHADVAAAVSALAGSPDEGSGR